MCIRDRIDEFVEIMLEVALTKSPTIKIGRDAEYPTAFVQQRFAKITCSHIEKEMCIRDSFYIPLAPPSAQKIFPHSFKISYANYTRTAGFCSLQIPCLL